MACPGLFFFGKEKRKMDHHKTEITKTERRKSMTETKTLERDKIAQLNRAMLGLGAPVERDGQGYNKPDFARMEGIGRLVTDLTLEEAYIAVTTLLRYKNTQLKGYKDELEATRAMYEEELKSLYPHEEDEAMALENTLEGQGHTQDDYQKKELVFVRLRAGNIYLAFQEHVSTNLRDFNARWVWDSKDDRYLIELPVGETDSFLEAARKLGRYGYVAPREMLDAVKKYNSEPPAAKPSNKPQKALPARALLPTGEKDMYRQDVYVLTFNDYEFNQKMWELKGTGLKYIDARSSKNSVRISTNAKLLPVLIDFLKERSVDVSAVAVSVIDKNKSGNTLIDVSTLALPFTPFPFQIEDAKTVIGK